MGSDQMRRHAPVAWNGQHLSDMFHFRGLVSLLHLVPTPSRVVTNGVEKVRRIAPWSQIYDGAVFFEVDASPVPDRDILARCKGTLTSDAHAPVLHDEETRIDRNDHISGIASLASTRSVQLGHVAVGEAVDSVGRAVTVVTNGLVLIRPRREELDQSSSTPNDGSLFYVEPIHPKWHHLVKGLGNHL